MKRIEKDRPVGGVTEKHFNAFLNRNDNKYETNLSHKKKLKTFLIWLNDNKLA